jgi:hypothetical protein
MTTIGTLGSQVAEPIGAARTPAIGEDDAEIIMNDDGGEICGPTEEEDVTITSPSPLRLPAPTTDAVALPLRKAPIGAPPAKPPVARKRAVRPEGSRGLPPLPKTDDTAPIGFAAGVLAAPKDHSDAVDAAPMERSEGFLALVDGVRHLFSAYARTDLLPRLYAAHPRLANEVDLETALRTLGGPIGFAAGVLAAPIGAMDAERPRKTNGCKRKSTTGDHTAVTEKTRRNALTTTDAVSTTSDRPSGLSGDADRGPEGPDDDSSAAAPCKVSCAEYYTASELDAMFVVDLKKICERNGLSQRGTKCRLRDTILAALAGPFGAAMTAGAQSIGRQASAAKPIRHPATASIDRPSGLGGEADRPIAEKAARAAGNRTIDEFLRPTTGLVVVRTKTTKTAAKAPPPVLAILSRPFADAKYVTASGAHRRLILDGDLVVAASDATVCDAAASSLTVEDMEYCKENAIAYRPPEQFE